MRYSAIHVLPFLVVLSLAAGCGTNVGNGGTNPPPAGVTLKFSAYSRATGVATLSSAVSSLTLCFKRLRFKAADGTSAGDIELALGEVGVNPAGTSLASVSVGAGTYTRIEFDLDNTCPSGMSVQLTNGNGAYSTSDGMTIRFEGSFTVTGASQALAMSIQAIVDALSTVSSDAAIKTAAEGASGSF